MAFGRKISRHLTFIPHLFACLFTFILFAFSDSEDSTGRWELDKGGFKEWVLCVGLCGLDGALRGVMCVRDAWRLGLIPNTFNSHLWLE